MVFFLTVIVVPVLLYIPTAIAGTQWIESNHCDKLDNLCGSVPQVAKNAYRNIIEMFPGNRNTQENVIIDSELMHGKINNTEDNHVTSTANQSFDFHHYQVISNNPRIFYFPKLLSDQDCDKLVALGAPYQQKYLTYPGHLHSIPGEEANHGSRYTLTNQQEDDLAVQRSKTRLSEITMIPKGYLQPMIIERYQEVEGPSLKEFHHPHYETPLKDGSSRIATLIILLSNVEEGGETIFPLLLANGSSRYGNPSSALHAATQCFTDVCANQNNTVIRMSPMKGSAILFYSHGLDNQLDPWAIHGSCPIIKGTKWLAKIHVGEALYHPFSHPDLIAHWKLASLIPSTYQAPSSLPLSPPLTLDSTRPSTIGRGGRLLSDSSGRVCTHLDLSPIGQSHAMTVSFMTRRSTCDRRGMATTVYINIPGSTNCCSWTIRVYPGCSLAMTGPDRNSTNRHHHPSPLTMSPHKWTHVVMGVESLDTVPQYIRAPNTMAQMSDRKESEVDLLDDLDEWKEPLVMYQEKPIESLWHYRSTLSLDAQLPVKARDSQWLSDVDAQWDNASVCVDKQEGIELQQLYILSRTLDPLERSWLYRWSVEMLVH